MQITNILGSTIPIIYTAPNGVIGRDAITNEFKEVNIYFKIVLILTICLFLCQIDQPLQNIGFLWSDDVLGSDSVGSR